MTLMVGGIIVAVVLLVVFPVMIIMSGGILASVIGAILKKSVDAAHVGTEELELSESNPY